MEVNISIPENVYQAMRIPDKYKTNILLKELAVVLYEQEILSFGKARELAKMNKWDFHELLGERGIERHFNINNLKEDIDYGKKNNLKWEINFM